MAYESWYSLDPEDIPTHALFMDGLDSLVNGKRILDIGCATGRKAEQIRKMGAREVYGIDINAAAIAKGALIYPALELSVQDAEHTTFPQGFFEFVNIQGTLACIEKDGRSKVLREAYRILTDSGVIHLSEFGRKVGFSEEYSELMGRTNEYGTDISYYNDKKEKFWSHNFLREELEELLSNSGFVVQAYDTKIFPTISRTKTIWGHMFIAKKKL